MGFLAQIVAGERKQTATYRQLSVDDLVRIYEGGRKAKTGDLITWRTALQVSTVLACARVIANGIAQVPFKVFQESDDGKVRLPAKRHPLYDLLHRRPNEWQTSYEYRVTQALHLVLAGNHYSFINRVPSGIVELIPFEPQSVTVKLADDLTLRYKVRMANGQQQEIPAEAIWHIRGLSWSGWLGLDAVQLAREAIGLAIATEAEHADAQRQGVNTRGVYSVEGTLTSQQYKELRQFIVENYTGANRGMPMILDRNAKWLSQTMSNVDQQHHETRRMQVEEICRALGVLPIMVGHTDKTATYASAEQMFIAHVVHTLQPWYECIEQSADVNLLDVGDRRAGYYTKFVAQGLLRGSMKDRGDYFSKALGSGGSPAWMTQDEVRGLDELNPMGGDAAALPKPTNVGGTAPKPIDDDKERQP